MTDVIIIGAGPAGLSAALNAAAEGLSTRVFEASGRTGGQAGTSSLIENYPGYPEGCSGGNMSRDFTEQAERLGAQIDLGQHVSSMIPLSNKSGYNVKAGRLWSIARCIIIAAGVDYRRLDVPGGDSELIKYGASADSHAQYAGQHVAIIGAANSAAQAALNLARHGAHVTMLARRTLEAGCSAYLVQRIRQHPRIEVMEGTTVSRANRIQGVQLDGGEWLPVVAAFAYIGAVPRTEFVGDTCAKDSRGFLLADPQTLESTTAPGVFIAGDVRAGSRKRFAAAVGEGAIAAARAWQFIHQKETM